MTMLRHTRFEPAIARLALMAVLIAACAQPASAPAVPPTPAQTSAATAAVTPTPTPSPGVSEFMTPEGYWTLGKVDAKVLFVDSSDFG